MSLLHFRMSGRLIMGLGALEELPEAVTRLGAGQGLVVTDAGIVEAGILDEVTETLEEAGLPTATFEEVESDPRIEIVGLAARAATEAKADVIIGLGGGSSMDIAKMAAIVARHGGDARDYLGIGNTPGRGLPTVLIPTTAGTGSEVTPIAVLSDTQDHLKKGVVSDHLYADVALVDPWLAVGCPTHVTAFTGMDALTHAIEAYTNKYNQPFVDTLAVEAIRLVSANLRRAVACGDDVDARSAMALASLYGGMCLGPVNTAAVHALAYPLGGIFGVPHGVANSLLLPYVMEFNLIADLERYADIADALGERTADLSMRDAAARSVQAVRRLADDVGIAAHMRALDIPESAIDEMAEGAMKVTRLLNNNPRTMTLEDAKSIYRAAW